MSPVPLDEVLAELDEWPVDHAAAGVTAPDSVVATHGPVDRVFDLASVTKPLAATGVLLAIQYGDVHLDEPAGPEGATVRHLLSHASGLPMTEGAPGGEVEQRRIYSNVGYDLLGELVEQRVGMPFSEHLRHELFAPLGMADTELVGSPAHAGRSTVTDLLAFARELLAPSLLDAELWEQLAETQFPELVGVLPGFGRHSPCPCGLGFEIHGDKEPHWLGPGQPPGVFGHFGQSGTFLWVDRQLDRACVVLTDRDFGDWAIERWAPFNDRVAAAA